MEELVEEPIDLIDKEIGASFKITFSELVLYNVVNLINKKISFGFSLMTPNGLETFYTPVYVVKDNATPLFFSQTVLLEKVTLEIIQFYLEKKMHFEFFTESIEMVKKLGKDETPQIIKEKQLFKHEYSSNFQKDVSPKDKLNHIA